MRQRIPTSPADTCDMISTDFRHSKLDDYSHLLILDIVCDIKAQDSSEEGPCSESARRQRGDLLGCLWRRVDAGGVVHARGVLKRQIGLDGIAHGDNGGLHSSQLSACTPNRLVNAKLCVVVEI
jgi:hypothetical protein